MAVESCLCWLFWALRTVPRELGLLRTFTGWMNSGLEDWQARWDRGRRWHLAASDGSPQDWFIYSHHAVWAQETACPCELVLEKGRESSLPFFFFFNPFIVQIFISTEAVTLKAAFEERDKGGQAWWGQSSPRAWEGRVCRDEERAPREEEDCVGSGLAPGASFPRPLGGLEVLTRLAALDAAAICPRSCSFPSLSPPPTSPPPCQAQTGFISFLCVLTYQLLYSSLFRWPTLSWIVCLGPGQGLIHPVTPCPALHLAHARAGKCQVDECGCPLWHMDSLKVTEAAAWHRQGMVFLLEGNGYKVFFFFKWALNNWIVNIISSRLSFSFCRHRQSAKEVSKQSTNRRQTLAPCIYLEGWVGCTNLRCEPRCCALDSALTLTWLLAQEMVTVITKNSPKTISPEMNLMEYYQCFLDTQNQ